MPESLTDRNTCHTCQKHRKKKLSKCKQCHAITYCGQECQVADWPRHCDNCVPVMVTDIPGKGRGLVAARDIKMGEQILSDKAVICLDNSCECRDCDEFTCCHLTPEITKMIAKQIDEMSNLDKEAFYKLQSSNVWDTRMCLREYGDQEDCLEELKIFFFNTRSRNLFLNIALLNHSCYPNAEMGEYGLELEQVSSNFKEQDGCELRAIKDISRGEEVTTFYLKKMSRDCLKTKAERQKTFKDEYGFECRCEVCFSMTSSRRFASFEGHLVPKTFTKRGGQIGSETSGR